MFKKILIANRGEIACRVMQTAQAMGIRCVAVYSDADRQARHVRMADEAYRLGPAPVSDSYLRTDKLIDIARRSGAEAIHPGYGFLSENPAFVEACEAAGIVFIGPPASAIQAMGLKDAAKKLMQEAGVAVIPGYHGSAQEPDQLAQEAAQIGYPVLIKARAGGGGKGMRKVDKAEDFRVALDSARREGEASFGDGHVLIEKYISTPRHIEVQVFADQQGNTVYLFERDCSLQRRHQKVIEEAPAPGMPEAMRAAMGEAAVNAAKAVGYVGAGTVEFIVDASAGLRTDRFWFMEMNTRLQVEHPVTEAITGLDLVEWQLRVAAGEPLAFRQEDLRIRGHAFEARVYAEDAARGFIPAIGKLGHLHLPADKARIDTGVQAGDEITPFYDPMIAKLTVHGINRTAALNQLLMALEDSQVGGCTTNIPFLAQLARHAGFRRGEVDTGLIERELDTLTAAPPPEPVQLAIAALASMMAAPASSDPWAQLTGWSHWPGSSHTHVDLQWQDEVFEVVVSGSPQQASVSVGGQTLLVRCSASRRGVQPGRDEESNTPLLSVSADVNGQSLQADVLLEPGNITLFQKGQTLRFLRPDPLAAAEDDAHSADQVHAPMPGQIKLVSARVGDSVEKGQVLLVMEAMKMELTLPAPRAGVVAEVRVQPGDQVTEGSILLLLEEEA